MYSSEWMWHNAIETGYRYHRHFDSWTLHLHSAIVPQGPPCYRHTYMYTHSAHYTRNTQTLTQATPPCTCPLPHVDTLAVKLLRFTWRHNWHKLLSRWYRSCCLRPSIPLPFVFLPKLKEEGWDKDIFLCMILISWGSSPRSKAPRPFWYLKEQCSVGVA